MGKSLPPKAIIGLGKFVWTTMWNLMMSNMAPRSKAGAYVRPDSQFRYTIEDTADSPFPPVAQRYRLYVGLGCPWAHRTLVVRALKGLQAVIDVVVVQPSATAGGWVFEAEHQGCNSLEDLYRLAQPGYDGRCTVPVLWDTQTRKIVNNESSEIIIILNTAFNQLAEQPDLDLYPPALQSTIDPWNDKIYHAVNNGVYRCGFAQTQAAYDQACHELFQVLDELDAVLADHRYLCGDTLTLADVRLFPTLFRFDVVYYGLFKCNRRRIQDYQHLGPYLRDLYQLPGVAETCNLEAVKQSYYGFLFPLNPGGIIPTGPDITSLSTPHQRDQLGQASPVVQG
ncbi:glutathione S-transferase family protein [Acaryochloris sp. IP29b_bin.148]|uniref:glutathione S-transferase family protein n=1 Tax=Acaryochloris sp. IP29b_bin.148 TaxID=2969218 RepID=UPI0026353C72|nr:glutathione S-transferase family protein [Acaryochloris sp. IP29b_bin.148]